MKSLLDLREEFGQYTNKMLDELCQFGERFTLFSKDMTVDNGIAYCKTTLIQPSTGRKISFTKNIDMYEERKRPNAVHQDNC